ncbi:MAG: polyhydroxyalkanoate synthesis repressor PhaR [Gammaproteobacteria bacterium]|nr:polyhydroxyalkanoate synthesis repressor PhaR [Gammaproteobacteria bacterium]
MAEPRVIKKYPNRRLYDTELSRYITLVDLQELVIAGEPFVVRDTSSGEDITRTILLQIIAEQESGGDPLFTTDILTRFIRFYGASMQGAFSTYLERSLSLFDQQQKAFQEQVREAMKMQGDPLSTITEMTQRNLEIWQNIQNSFFNAAGVSEKKTGKKTKS